MSLVGWKVVVAIPWFPKRDMSRGSGTWQDMVVTQAHHVPAIKPFTPQVKGIQLKIIYIRHRGTCSLGTTPICNQ